MDQWVVDDFRSGLARLELELWVEPEKLLDCLAVNRFQKACDRGGDCQSEVVRLVPGEGERACAAHTQGLELGYGGDQDRFGLSIN